MTPDDAPQWRSGFALGNALLDRQHILLFELARTLHDPAVDDACAKSTVADILDLAQRHCAAEEFLLTLNGFEWTDQHREEHVVGLDRLSALSVEFALGTLSRQRAATAVSDWLVLHIEDMDLPAREYLQAPASRVLPEPGPDPLDAGWS